jgi:hypothetical protein
MTVMPIHPDVTPHPPPTGAADTRPLPPVLQPNFTTLHMGAVSPTVSPTLTSHIPQPTGISTSTLREETLLVRPMFLDNDYDQTLDHSWDGWHKDDINLIVQNKPVSEKWRTNWTEKDTNKFSRIKFIFDFIEAHFKEKPVGMLIVELN